MIDSSAHVLQYSNQMTTNSTFYWFLWDHKGLLCKNFQLFQQKDQQWKPNDVAKVVFTVITVITVITVSGWHDQCFLQRVAFLLVEKATVCVSWYCICTSQDSDENFVYLLTSSVSQKMSNFVHCEIVFCLLGSCFKGSFFEVCWWGCDKKSSVLRSALVQPYKKINTFK